MTTVKKTAYSKVQGLCESNEHKLSNLVGSRSARDIKYRPTLRANTINKQIMMYLKKRKKAATVNEIAEKIYQNRWTITTMENATRAANRCLLQLLNWNYITVDDSKRPATFRTKSN